MDIRPTQVLHAQYAFDTSAKNGAVVQGKNTLSGKSVSAKVIAADAISEFLAGEGHVRSVLNAHPHAAFPRIVGIVSDSSPAYLVMDGTYGDLHSFVRDHGPLAEGAARELFQQVVSGVAHCHALGIVLRDMKLGKICFADSNGSRVVIADLEGAQVLPRGAMTLVDQKGSPAYVAPEVLACRPYSGAQADIWSLGVILYVILTGTYPFQDPVPAGLFQKISLGVFSTPKHVSPRAQRLLRKMLCRDPSMRFTALDVLADPWFSLPVDAPMASMDPQPATATDAGARASRAAATADDQDHVVPDAVAIAPCGPVSMGASAAPEPAPQQRRPSAGLPARFAPLVIPATNAPTRFEPTAMQMQGMSSLPLFLPAALALARRSSSSSSSVSSLPLSTVPSPSTSDDESSVADTNVRAPPVARKRLHQDARTSEPRAVQPAL